MNTLLVALVLAITFAVFLWWSKKQKAKPERSPEFLGLPSGQWQACTGETQSPRFLFIPERRQGKHNKPPELSVQVTLYPPCDLVLRPITAGDRLGLAIGLARTLPTGDEEFDRQVYVEATHERFPGDLLAKPEARAEILKVFALGFQRLIWSAAKGTLTAHQTGYIPSGARNIQTVGDTAASLESLASLGTGLEAGPLPDWNFRRNLGLAWCWLWLVALPVLSAYCFYNVTQVYPPLTGNWFHAAPWIFVGMSLFVPQAWFVFRDSPKGHETLGMWSVVVAILLAAGVYPVFFTLNGWLDKEPGARVELPVKNVYFTRTKNHTNYYAVLDATIGGRLVDTVSIDTTIHDMVKRGQLNMAEVEYGPGHFGFPWKKSLGFSLKKQKPGQDQVP